MADERQGALKDRCDALETDIKAARDKERAATAAKRDVERSISLSLSLSLSPFLSLFPFLSLSLFLFLFPFLSLSVSVSLSLSLLHTEAVVFTVHTKEYCVLALSQLPRSSVFSYHIVDRMCSLTIECVLLP